MEKTTENTAKLILAEIARARQYSQLPTPTDLFLSAETLVSGLATLIGPMIDAETAYRQQIALSIEEGASAAAAEAKAKAGTYYADMKKLQLVYDLAEHQLNVVKKFKDDLGQEYRRSLMHLDLTDHEARALTT